MANTSPENRTVYWLPDEAVVACEACYKQFGWTKRKHHCRWCGHIFCGSCTVKKSKTADFAGRLCLACEARLSEKQEKEGSTAEADDSSSAEGEASSRWWKNGWNWFWTRKEAPAAEPDSPLQQEGCSTALPEPLHEAPPRETFIVTPYGRTAVSIYNEQALAAGSGTVIIVHGCGGERKQFSESKMAQRLACTRRVITFDLFGHGESTGCDAYPKEVFVEQLSQVVHELVPAGLSQGLIDLYGFSMGCFIVCHYCRIHPRRIGKVVLQSPWNAETSAFAPGLRNAARIPVVGIATIAGIRRLCFPHCHDALTLKKIILTLGEGQTAWAELLGALADSNHPNCVLIICGEAEKPFLEVSRNIHEHWASKSQLVICPHASHMSWYVGWDKEVGTLFRNRIHEFLVEEQQGGAGEGFQ